MILLYENTRDRVTHYEYDEIQIPFFPITSVFYLMVPIQFGTKICGTIKNQTQGHW